MNKPLNHTYINRTQWGYTDSGLDFPHSEVNAMAQSLAAQQERIIEDSIRLIWLSWPLKKLLKYFLVADIGQSTYEIEKNTLSFSQPYEINCKIKCLRAVFFK